MIKKEIYPKTQRLKVDGERVYITEKLGKIYDGFSDSYYDTCLVKIAQKVDEVIDAVNKLKVDGKD